MYRYSVRHFLTVVFSLLVVVFLAAPKVDAAYPTVTIDNTPGQIITESTFTVTGTFRADTDLKSIQVVLCKVATATATACTSYAQDTTGTFGTTWKSRPASVETADSRTGTYTLTYTNLVNSYYRAAVFAADQTIAKGPRAYLNFKVEAPVEPPANSRFITILWGKSMWQPAADTACTDTAGTRTLEQNAQDMQARGLFGVGGVVINRTAESGLTCYVGGANNLQPSWEELALLRDTYNWTFVSQGMTYSDMTLMKTDEERYNESGATLPILEAHGHTRAWGAFNYPNNRQNPAAQNIVTKYFAFGRKYTGGANTKTSVSVFPYTMSTNSVNGGRCNNPSLPCYNMAVLNNRRTTSVETLKKILNPAHNGWGVVQFYRIVEGKRGVIGDKFAWDCTSTDWRDRWTSIPEMTCRESFLEVLEGRSLTATVADPATVAETWNVFPADR